MPGMPGGPGSPGGPLGPGSPKRTLLFSQILNSFQRHLLSEKSPCILYWKSHPCKLTNIYPTEKNPTLQRLLIKARDLSSLNRDCPKVVSRLHTHILNHHPHQTPKMLSSKPGWATQYRPWSRTGVNKLLTLCMWKHSASK